MSDSAFWFAIMSLIDSQFTSNHELGLLTYVKLHGSGSHGFPRIRLAGQKTELLQCVEIPEYGSQGFSRTSSVDQKPY